MKSLYVWLPVLLLAACAQTPKRSADLQPAASAPQPQPARAAGREEGANLPNVELTPNLLYQLISAEFASEQGATILAYSQFMELAQRTRDPRLARRAADMANADRDLAKVIRASTLWAEIDRDSAEAQLSLAQALLNAGRGEEAAPLLDKLLAGGTVEPADVFSKINGYLSRNPDRKGTLAVIQRMAAKYPDLAGAHLAVARAAADAGEDDLAVSEARAAGKLRPDSEAPVRLAAEVLVKRSPAEASAELKRFLDGHPKSDEIRILYAHSLYAEKKTAEARTEFARVERNSPGNPGVLAELARLSILARDYTNADIYLKKLLAADPRDANVAYFYLGQSAEEQKKYAQARDWWKQVSRGEQFFIVQPLIAGTYAKEGKVAEGRAYLQTVPVTNNQQRVQIIVAEAQLLRDANMNREAFDVLEKGLEKLPNHPDLLYESAMIAEKLLRLDVQETQLRKLIQIKPDSAHAYNALGYSLAERNERLAEAKALIEKALKIAPDDAAIIDSMGWVLYRLGDLARAEELLRRAYEARPDAEIAAHLGEVLWQANKRPEAERVWRDALAKAPDDETLKNTVKRLKR